MSGVDGIAAWQSSDTFQGVLANYKTWVEECTSYLK